jgi:hypothetical protein
MHIEEEFGKEVTTSKKLHRPIISESVKKSVILNDQKQKLHEMKQKLLDEEERRKTQDAIEQEELVEEESQGMSM